MSFLACSKTVSLYEIENSDPQFSIDNHKGIVHQCLFTQNNSLIGTCGNDGKVFIISAKSPKYPMFSLEDPDALDSQIYTIAFPYNSGSNLSKYLASGGSDNIVKIWDLKSKNLQFKYKTHFGPITSLDWNINDYILASSSLTGDIVLHNINNTNGLPIANFNQKASGGIKVIRFSPFVKELLGSGSNEGVVSIWDINKRNYSCTFNMAHNKKVTSLAFSPNNQALLCSTGIDQNIQFYDINAKKYLN